MGAEIGPIAQPDHIQWAPGLPKTRSGKIMRRILRKIAADEHEHLGDTRRSPIPPSSPTLSRTAARRARERLAAAALAAASPHRRLPSDHARDLEPRMDDGRRCSTRSQHGATGATGGPAGEDRSIPCDLAPKAAGARRTRAHPRVRRYAARGRRGAPGDRRRDVARTIFPSTSSASRGAARAERRLRHPAWLGFRCNRDYQALGLPEDTVRWGADVTIEPGTGARCGSSPCT